MLDIFRSNKLEVLVEILAAQLGVPGALPADPFAPLRVVVGSKGMERWLRHQLAAKLPGHICANAQFPFPQAVLAEALSGLEGPAAGGPAPRDPWHADALTWAVLEVLPDLLGMPGGRAELQPLRDYLGDAVGGVVAPRALELAAQLADVFDRLVVYRPQLAVDWSMGGTRLPTGAADLSWLPLLWQAVHHHLLQVPGGGAHTAQRWRALTSSGPVGDVPFDQPVRVFGIAALPPSYLRQLAWLSRGTPVELYVLCPSNAYWADLHGLGRGSVNQLLDHERDHLGERLGQLSSVRPHPLLQSMGRVGRDMQLVLEGLGDSVTDRSTVDAFLDPAPQLEDGQPAARALHTLQSDILYLRDPMAFGEAQRALRTLEPGDDSLQLHACYGQTRQVEVLRDALLHLFEAHPDLEPRDVLVMVPDIESYVPLIGAVFDQGRDRPAQHDGQPMLDERWRWGSTGAPHIPYAVTERSVRRTNPVADVMLRVLELASGQARVSAVTVLDLLAIEPFRLRFGIQHADIEAIGRWVQQSGIRWGIDPADRQDHQQPGLSQNTWRFGLERLALGVTMADQPGRLWDRPPRLGAPTPERGLGVVPVDALEGGIVHLLGRFFDACTTLFDELERLAGQRDLQAWVSLLLGDPSQPPGSIAGLGTLGRLADTPPKGGWLTARVRTELEAVRQAAELGLAARELSIQAFHTLLAGRFEVASGATHAHTGAVTFAAMAPYRSVPYRVICLLGMDEGAFPRPASRKRFDPTQRAPRAGDRDARDEDRYLLLEALLAARDHLLVFYTGRDPRSNEPCAPAVPVGELLEVVDATFGTSDDRTAREHITLEHPLQAFSLECFDSQRGKARAWSYDQGLLVGARASMNQDRDVPTFFPTDDTSDTPTPAGPDKPVRELTLEQLAWFLRNPAKTLLARGLNLYLPRDEEPLPHREPVEPNGLDRWSWLGGLVADRWARLEARWDPTVIPPMSQADPIQRLRAQGDLPLGSGGDRWVQAPGQAADMILDFAAGWFGSEDNPATPTVTPVDLSFDMPYCTVRLRGTTGPIWHGDQLCVGSGKIHEQGKYRIEPWVRHLAWVASSGDADARTVLGFGRLDGSGKPNLQTAALTLALGDDDDPAEYARRLLDLLVRLYLQGLEQPVPLFPEASYKFAYRAFFRGTWKFGPEHLALDADDLDPDIAGHMDAALLQARKSFGSMGGGSGWSSTDLDDPYVARLWAGRDPIQDPAFGRVSLMLWHPLFSGFLKPGKKISIAPRTADTGGDA